MQLVIKGEDKDWVKQITQHIGLPSKKILISVNEENKREVEV